MRISKFPIALWEDSCKNVTVVTLAGVRASAVAEDRPTALKNLKKYLAWYLKENDLEPDIDFSNPKLKDLRLDLRGSFFRDFVRFPNEYITDVTYQFVEAQQKDGAWNCVFPKLGISFHCTQTELIPSLAQDLVRDQFARLTSNEIAMSVSAASITLDSINIRVEYRDGMNRLDLSTANLQQVTMKMAERGSRREFETAWNRREIVSQLVSILQRRMRNVLLVGKAGVGKTTILAEAAKTLRNQKPESSRNKTDSDGYGDDERDESADENSTKNETIMCWLTNASRLISGMVYLGQWQERCESLVSELSETGGVLCIENLLDLVLTGSDPGSSLAAFFRSFMINDELRMVAEATPAELETIRRLIPGFDSLFEIIRVEEMNEPDSVKVLENIANVSRHNQKLETDPAAPVTAVQLFRRFLPYDPFPGKCVAFWKKRIRNRLQIARKEKVGPTLTVDDVVSAFRNDAGLPEFLLRDETLLSASAVRNHFEIKIIGQPQACEAMTDLVMRIKSAMNDPARPFAVQLFCGPTGVGKTETAKVIASYLFGAGQNSNATSFGSGMADSGNHPGAKKQNRLIRLDMSEYGAIGSAQRLLTKPDGTPSPLIEQIRLHPFSVVLLDEIEKAAPEVFDALMTMFDEGYLVDLRGREISFRSAVIILTSNLGSQVADGIGFGESAGDVHLQEVRKFFRPEFFNRMDAVINFRHLRPEDIEQIAVLDIEQIANREGLKQRNLRLICDRELIAWLSRKGYDHRLGARSLLRTIESHIITPIARYLAENPQACDLTLTLKLVEGRIVLSL